MLATSRSFAGPFKERCYVIVGIVALLLLSEGAPPEHQVPRLGELLSTGKFLGMVGNQPYFLIAGRGI
jgi:hypothetical protein